MPNALNETNFYKRLRDTAEARLQAGTPPAAGHWTMGADALHLLHKLSSDPDKGQDALKLLHELQVHQVELDLQNEAIAANEQVLEEDFLLHRTLYEHAPFGYCVVDFEGVVMQCNRAACALFGIDPDQLQGQRIDRFLRPQDQARVLSLLQGVAESGARGSCVAETRGGAEDFRQVQFLASIHPAQQQLLLACCECNTLDVPGSAHGG